MRHKLPLVNWMTPLVAIALAACTQVRPPSLPVAATGETVLPPSLAPGLQQGARGTIALTIRWPERSRATQVIPLSTNSLIIQVRDSDDRVLASQTIARPANGPSEATANLEVGAGHAYRMHVAAYQEEVPGFDSVPIAVGTADQVVVDPGAETTVRIALVPTAGPVILSVPSSGGPLSFVAIHGQHFESWYGAIKVTFGGIDSPIVVGSATDLMALVPNNAVDGPLTVTADGITVISPGTFRIIRSLTLTPASNSTTVHTPLLLQATARDAAGDLIPSPVINWRFDRLTPYVGLQFEPTTTLEEGVFTPGSTGSFEVTVNAGSICATASVTVH